MTLQTANACQGCGMVDPCGYHFSDCTLLEAGDFAVPRILRGSEFSREQFGEPVAQYEVRLRYADGSARTVDVLERSAEDAEFKAVQGEPDNTVAMAYESQEDAS